MGGAVILRTIEDVPCEYVWEKKDKLSLQSEMKEQLQSQRSICKSTEPLIWGGGAVIIAVIITVKLHIIH